MRYSTKICVNTEIVRLGAFQRATKRTYLSIIFKPRESAKVKTGYHLHNNISELNRYLNLIPVSSVSFHYIFVSFSLHPRLSVWICSVKSDFPAQEENNIGKGKETEIETGIETRIPGHSHRLTESITTLPCGQVL